MAPVCFIVKLNIIFVVLFVNLILFQMKKVLFLLTIIVLLSSCDKQYKYIEIVNEPSIIGSGYSKKEKDAKTISAKNDTLAYLKAFHSFCISQKVYEDMKKDGRSTYLSIPLDFKLLNSNGENIVNTFFATRADSERKITDRIFSMGNVVNKKEDKEIMVKNEIVIDSIRIKELLPYFTSQKDEFDKNGSTWYKPKSAPIYINRNAIYCYFQIINDKPTNFRFQVQYYAEDWLFFSKCQFSIDGTAYEYIPNNVETDHNGGNIWEWFDERVYTNADIELIEALAKAKEAKIRFVGRQYHNIKTITKSQIIDIKRSLDLYKAMGGKL